ncbi:MAG: hypothetical protein HOP15_03480, partial [Planctomycetes bacterium]|nr:hypothetical protein [Planctomycetota bacterium]
MARSKDSAPTLFDLAPLEVAAPRAPAGCYARVALNRPVQREFTYALPAGLAPAHALALERRWQD